MRILCTICTELFDGTCDVSAVPCGHTFHSECLSRWLATSLTCPQCRTRVSQKAVISKLYFSQPDGRLDGVSELEPNQLVNELESAKFNLRLKDAELSRHLAERLSAEEKLNESKQIFRELEKLHKDEIAKSKLLKQELVNYKDMQNQTAVAKQEAADLRKKLAQLHNVQKVINGSEDEIENMIEQNSDVRQLATWCSVYKKELERKKADSRELQESNRKLKRDLDNTKSLLSERTGELETAKADLSSQDEQIKSLKKKLETLQAAIASPNSTSSSFARRLINESPAPAFSPSERPKLSRPQPVNLDLSLDLFDDSPLRVSSTGSSEANIKSQTQLSGKRRLVGQEIGDKIYNPIAKSIKITSAADNIAVENSNVGGIQDLLKLNILKNRQSGLLSNTSGIFRQGFNGLGGHEKFIQPPPRKPLMKMNRKNFFRSSSTSAIGKIPPLPTLIDVDSDG